MEVPGDEETYNIYLDNIYYDYKCIWTPNKIEYYINDNLIYEIQNQNQEWYPYLYLAVRLSQQVINAANYSG